MAELCTVAVGEKGEGAPIKKKKKTLRRSPEGTCLRLEAQEGGGHGRKLNKGISSCMVEAEGEAGNVAGDDGTMTRGGNS